MNFMPNQISTPANGHGTNHKVALCAYDGLCTFEFGIAVEVFGLPRPEFESWYDFSVCAVEPGPLRAAGGFSVSADTGLTGLASADTIIIAGWRGAGAAPPRPFLDALIKAHRRGARLVSFCSGVFVLAAAGLLDDKRVTTHWRYAAALRAAYPHLNVDPDVLYVDEGSIMTSAGSAAGLDLCLHIVGLDHGPLVAGKVARRLVMPLHRDGGQAQFIERPEPDETARLSRLLGWARANLDQPIRIKTLARRARMSQRTFERRFCEATGTTPARWLIRERLAYARELLETSTIAVEQVATATGFRSADTLRHHFRNQLGTSPLQYRNSFRA